MQSLCENLAKQRDMTQLRQRLKIKQWYLSLKRLALMMLFFTQISSLMHVMLLDMCQDDATKRKQKKKSYVQSKQNNLSRCLISQVVMESIEKMHENLDVVRSSRG
jgi:hypothetical protein